MTVNFILKNKIASNYMLQQMRQIFTYGNIIFRSIMNFLFKLVKEICLQPHVNQNDLDLNSQYVPEDNLEL